MKRAYRLKKVLALVLSFAMILGMTHAISLGGTQTEEEGTDHFYYEYSQSPDGGGGVP